MASIYLDSGDTFTLSNAANVYGGAGTEKLIINSGATGVVTDQRVERVDLAGASSAYTYQAAGNMLKVYSGTTLVATIPVQDDADGSQLVFTNGSVSVKVGATGMTLGGATVTSTAAAVTPTTIDATVTSGAGTSTTGGTTAGQSFSLTTAAQIVSGTTGNDTIDGTTTVDSISGDTIVDSTTTDADVANIKLTVSPATKATVNGIETINVDFAGFAIAYDASSTSNGKIVATSSQAGNTGATINGVDGAKSLQVQASTGIKTLTLDDLAGNASITVGSATTVNLNGTTDATDAVTLKVSGNTVTLDDNAGTEELKTLNVVGSSSASTLTLTTSVVELATASSIVLSGDQSLTIKAASADVTALTITDSTTAGTTTLDITATTSGNDLSKAGTDKIKISGATNTHALTFATGDSVILAFDVAATDIDLVAASGTTGTINLELAGDAGITDNNTTYFSIVNVNANDTTSQPVDGKGTDFQAILNADVTLNLTGSTNLDLNAASVAKEVNAATYTGNLTASVVAAKVTKLTSGTGDDTITIGTSATAFTVDGGNGTDTLVAGVADIASVTASNFEVLDLANVDVTDAKDTMFSGKTMVIKSTGDTNGTLDIDEISTTTVNLANITIDETTMKEFAGDAGYAITMDFNAQTLALNLTGSKGSDSIEGGTNADTIQGGNGADNLEGNAGNDQISGGEGKDIITGGNGDDTIDLTEAVAAVDTVHLQTTGKDTITAFGSTDLLNVEILAGGNVAAESAETVGAQEAVATGTTAYIFSTDGTAGSLTTGGSKTVTDWTSTTQVAAFLGERFTVADNDVAAFIVNVGSTTYVYDMNDADDTTLDAADLTLVGVISQTAALGVANVDFA